MSPRRKPPWSNLRVEFEDHAYERMEERKLIELEVRHMLEHSRRYRRSRHRGRWLIFAQL